MTDKIVDFVVYKFSICIHLVFHALHFGFGNGHRYACLFGYACVFLNIAAYTFHMEIYNTRLCSVRAGSILL